MLRTESYIYGNHEFIEAGEIYYFGQLWDGTDGDGKELLESGCLSMTKKPNIGKLWTSRL